MRAIPDQEFTNVLIGNSQIQASGVQKAQRMMKKEAKSNAKTAEGAGKQKKKK